MKRTILLAVLPLGAIAAVGAVLAPRPERGATTASRPIAEESVDVLVQQLHRRFTDTRDIDFGFSRIARPKGRLHVGPTMGHTYELWSMDRGGLKVNGKFARQVGNRDLEVRAEDGTWIDFGKAKPQMRPENPTEEKAIETLVRSKRDLALYTYGVFKDGEALRMKGPAYLGQKGPKAPDPDRFASAAAVAWKGGVPTLPGFRLRTEKVFAEASCVKCHNEMRAVDAHGQPLKSPTIKAGDALGLILLAEKL